MFKYILLAVSIFTSTVAMAQISDGDNGTLNPQTARTGGPMTPLQAAYDVIHYGINLSVNPTEQSIKGFATMQAVTLTRIEAVEMDLDPRYVITSVSIDGVAITPVKQDGKLLLPLAEAFPAGKRFETLIHYSGTPHVAMNAPWDGGFVWATTPSGKPWIATAVQGNGCDLIFPCKDHVADKTDGGVDMVFEVPKGLKVAMAGVLKSVTEGTTTDTFHWSTRKPLSPYHIAINIGPYERLEYTYRSINGVDIPVEFWALEENANQARALVENDFLKEIAYFEDRLGPYPWGDEKIGVAETPHLGMEHQTMNAYGNRYRTDWRAYDWLLQHEFAHEWWGNLLTQKQSRDFWLHEGTNTYMQPDYAGYLGGHEKYMEYFESFYPEIQNCGAIVPDGDPTDNDLAAGNDTYYKTAWMLHTLRNKIGDEKFWNAMKRLLYNTTDTKNITYPIKPILRNTAEAIAIFNDEAGEDLNWFFDVYLREAAPLKLSVEDHGKGSVNLTWDTPNARPFSLAVPVKVGDTMISVSMDGGMGSFATNGQAYEIDPEHSILMHREGLGRLCQ